ncbi:phosphotransferase, partial [Klebsiella pneumoniae]|uniref:phosphotransferase n=1 Tax=Klebsiella pneumoniae TaxID=573 RepID=UPI0020325DF7
EWVHVQLHQQKGMISLSPPTICNSALIDNTERVSGMIDWSEARVDDPAIDMAAHLMVFGEEGLAKLLLTYEAAGGRVWPRLAHHIAERLAFGAVTYALFALDSGNEEYLAAAKAQLAAAE